MIAERLQHTPDNETLIKGTNLIRDSAANLAGSLRSLQTASSRNWLAAERLLISDCQNSIKQTERLLSKIQQALTESGKRPRPETKEIFLDLVALHEEFDELRFDAKAKLLSVVSKRIDLEDVHLGRFKIQLELNSLSAETTAIYEVDRSRSESSGAQRERYSSACRTQSTLRRRCSAGNSIGFATRTLVQFLSDRSASAWHVQLVERLRATLRVGGRQLQTLWIHVKSRRQS